MLCRPLTFERTIKVYLIGLQYDLERKDLSNDRLIQFYRNLLWPRMIEEKCLCYYAREGYPNGLVVLARKQ